MYFNRLKHFLLAAALLSVVEAAVADINVGVTLSTTGPAASLGIPEKNAVALFTTRVGEHKVNYIILDDASDPTRAVVNVRKFVTEHKVDLIIGSSTTPNSLAMIDVVAESETPMISLAASSRIVEPVDAKRRWVFKTPQNDSMMSLAVAEHMARTGIRKVASIGFADAYGDSWNTEFTKAAEVKRLQVVTNERYNRTDTSVTGQMLRILAQKPDAVFIAGAGTPAVLPHRTLKERGYTGLIYQTHGVANNDFLRVGGAALEGTYLPAGPVLVAEQLPATSPLRDVGMKFTSEYESLYGKGSMSVFAAFSRDAGLLFQVAADKAVRTAAPGTKEFRAALRDAIENIKELPATNGVFNMSATDHLGFDERARVMVKIEKGTWKYLRETP